MNIFEKSSKGLYTSNTDAKAELAHPIKWVKALALFLVLIIPSTFTVNSYGKIQSKTQSITLPMTQSEYNDRQKHLATKYQRIIDDCIVKEEGKFICITYRARPDIWKNIKEDCMRHRQICVNRHALKLRIIRRDRTKHYLLCKREGDKRCRVKR